ARRGLAGYLRVAAGSLDLLRAAAFTIEADGVRHELRALTVAVANGPQYGGHAFIAPGARLDDGRLDVTAVPPITPLNALPLVTALFRGTLDARTDVFRASSSRIVIECPSPGPLHTDGEVRAAGSRVEFTVRPASLRVLSPA
ncbi:MAG: hypothetical protein RLZZ188_1520, partial [Verrucomicrobiota bacterium]